MLYRKDIVAWAVTGVFACCGFAAAQGTVSTQLQTPALSLEPQVVTAQDSGAPSTLLMLGLDKVGVAKPLQTYGINIYGWIEGGYDANLRNNAGSKQGFITRPVGYTQELGNHFALNQLALRIEKLVDPKKWDVGGLVEANFGTDTYATTPARDNKGGNTSGWEFQTPGDNPGEVPHFDFTQAYVDVNVPVGNGVKIRAGRMYTVTGYESFDPRGNPFYSHSYLYDNEPVENTGVLGFYQLNDQWSFAGGISRGINQNTEDDNGAIDGLGQVTYTLSKQWQFVANVEVGPQNSADNSHYDFIFNPIVVFQATDKLKFAAEGLYDYDGGFNGFPPVTHAYGDNYGIALYGQYALCQYATANLRAEWIHTYAGVPYPLDAAGIASSNAYEITAGFTIHPLPKDPIGKNLVIRPELRYDVSEDHDYATGANHAYKDMWSVGADVIFTF
ncbi:MAG TPA: outer membrane beta-barrel protein [Phycisphaerae bacterium]|nr:outer membrane beta-barrel protein [Phycisphaerae bacterium]